MADEVVSLEIDIDLKNAQSIGEFKNAVKDLQAHAEKVKLQFGAASEEYKKFSEEVAKKTALSNEELQKLLRSTIQNAKSVGDLREAWKSAQDAAVAAGGVSTNIGREFLKIGADAKEGIKDLKEQISALDRGDVGKQLVGFTQTIAGGFAAAQGAAALFGGENENVAKTLVKIQAATALLQGVQAIADARKYADVLKIIFGLKAQAAAQDDVTKATEGTSRASKVLRGALIATGIGALVALIGTLIANWDKVTKGFVNTFPVLGKLGAIVEETKAVFSGLWSSVKAVFENIGKAFEVLWFITTGQFSKAKDAIKEFHSVSEAYEEGHQEKLNEIAQEKANERLANLLEQKKRELAVRRAAGQDTYNLERQILQDELKLLDKGADDYAKLYADKLNEIKVLDAQHKKELNDKAEKQTEEDIKNAKDRAEKERQIEEQLRAARIANIQDARARELAEIENSFGDKIAAITGHSLQENALRNELNTQMLNAISAANKKFADEDAKTEEENAAKELSTYFKLEEGKLSLMKEGKDKEIRAAQLAFEKKFSEAEGNAELEKQAADKLGNDINEIEKKWADQSKKTVREKVAAQLQTYTELANTFVQIMGNNSERITNEQNAALDAETRNRMAAFDAQSAAKLQASNNDKKLEAELAKQREKLVSDYEAKKKQIEKAAFERNKNREAATAAISGLSAIMRIAADVPKADFGVTTALMIGAQAALTATTIAKIKSQNFEGGGGGFSAPTTSGGAGAGGNNFRAPNLDSGGRTMLDDAQRRRDAGGQNSGGIVLAPVIETEMSEKQHGTLVKHTRAQRIVR